MSHQSHTTHESASQSAARHSTEGPTRRRTLAGVGLLAGTSVAVSACGADGDSSSDKSDIDPNHPVDIAAASDVPEGGAIKVSSDGMTAVVTQPTQGEYKAFSSSCTHQGCSVNVRDESITCPCHSSTFSIQDGSVQGGPAPKPLPEYKVTVDGGRIRLS
ncbi:Rieske (2Fe-2S) protein [Rothia sp. HC945]|uniref:Rieske (2Fe-2S) protein n=1 Tax=Rothia sp. HC945 TaxID=3171170 RepID=UPI003F23C782